MMSIIALLLFVICPIMVLPFLFLGLKKDKKHKNVYLIIIAIFVALFSYNYRPKSEEDLYRHHIDTMQYEDASVEVLAKDISQKPEQLSTVYKFIISKTGNQDLLQFFTSAMSFFILFYLLNEYTEKNKDVKGWKLFGIWIFVLAGFHFIVITSGIFYTLALEVFSLGVYLDYEKKRKVWGWTFYIMPMFIHTCAFLPFILILLFKILGSKNNIKNILILVGLIMSIGFLLMVIAPNIDLPIVKELSNLYKWYFNNEEVWADMHSIPILIMYMSRLLPVIFGRLLSNKRESIGDFAIFMTIAIVVLYFQTTFSIRYIHIAVLCGLPLIFEAAKNKKHGGIYCVSLYALAVPHIIYQVNQIFRLGKFENAEKIFVTNLITMLGGG